MNSPKKIKYLHIFTETCGGDASFTVDNINQIEKMFTDLNFLVPIDRKVKDFARHLIQEGLPIYYYNYR